MDKPVKDNFQSLQSYFKSIELKSTMEALVSDLSHALDESQTNLGHRKRRTLKRRSVGITTISTRISSGESSSSDGQLEALSQERRSSIPFSDSDGVSPSRHSGFGTPRLIPRRIPANLAESDSVNENISPGVLHSRRKQKTKRLALDPTVPCSSFPPSSFRRDNCSKLSTSPDIDGKDLHVSKFRFLQISSGKRKRGRDKVMDWDTMDKSQSPLENKSKFGSTSKLTSDRGARSPDKLVSAVRSTMEVTYEDDSHSTGSSSESEAGIYTCDEGREADDEQSDWFAEPGAVYGVPGGSFNVTKTGRGGSEGETSPHKVRRQFKIHSNDEDQSHHFLSKSVEKENNERISSENQHLCRLRFQKLRERLLRREIRAGRRRLQDRRPGFSIVSSVNQKVSRFLQDPAKSELKLKPMTDRDRAQLWHLARLYSLNLRPSDDLPTAPILTKTQKTITTTRYELSGLSDINLISEGTNTALGDLKRRRKGAPDTPNLTEGSNDSLESVVNVGCQGTSDRPPVPTASWGTDDAEEEPCADSLSERLADSEPDPVPSPTSLALQKCSL